MGELQGVPSLAPGIEKHGLEVGHQQANARHGVNVSTQEEVARIFILLRSQDGH